MLFRAKFDQFSFKEFNAFIWELYDKHKFRNILFEPANGLSLFTNQQITHAAPDRDISHPGGFIGQWAKNEDGVKRVKFRFSGPNGRPDIEMTVDLDDRTISLDSAAGITSEDVKKVLHSSFPRISDIAHRKAEDRLEPNLQVHKSREKTRALPKKATSLPKAGRKIFLVHGHDKQALHETARFLENIVGRKNVIVLGEQPNKGKTIIEKFERYANVGFAVVLLTPDDRGGAAKTAHKNQKPRARQNVIFELGYFIGRLRRDKVCALHRKEVEIPSDYKGILYVELDEAGSWKMKLVSELKAAGFRLDTNKVF